MSSSDLSRRRLLQAAEVAAFAAASPAAFTSFAPVARAAALPPVRDDIGVSAFPFDLDQVRLTASRWMDNQNRTLTTGNAAGSWTMRLRIPSWTSGATISVNGTAQNIATTPGTSANLTRTWASGDTVTVRMPMRVVMQPANDNANVAAVTYGPVVLSGNYGDTALSTLPALAASSVTRTSSSSLAFTATADGSTVNLGPFYNAHGHNYTVYWNAGSSTSPGFRLFNAASGMVLGIRDMSTADGGSALQWRDTGRADHNWQLVTDGTTVRLRNGNSGKVLGVERAATGNGARVLQWADNGTDDHLWRFI